MAVITAWKTGAAHAVTIGAAEKITFSASDSAFQSYRKDTWNPKTIVVDAALAFVAAGKNCKYIAPTQIDIGAGTVTLDTTAIATGDCTLKIEWQDDAINTALSNIKFYAYDGTTPATAPANLTVVAFERAAAAINKNRTGGDTTGKAWDAAYGIGGSANALALDNQASAATHTFYIGISARPGSYGQNTGVAFRLEFDVE